MKSDERVRYTRARIQSVFLEFLSKKDLSKITVTDICRQAEVNRTTFYNHYMDIYDLLDKTENDILESTRKQWKLLHPKNSVHALETLLLRLRSEGIGVAFSIFKSDPDFAFKITEFVCHDTCADFMKNAPFSPEEKERINRFVVYGCGSIVRNWITGADKSTAREVAECLYRLIEKNTRT